jgi:hypothetical protein
VGKPSSSGAQNPGRDDSRISIIVFVTSQVKPEKLFISMFRRPKLPLAAGLAFCLASAAAHADSPDCGLRTNCGLTRALHILYVAAGVLGVIFAIVLAAAFYLYRRNKRTDLLR